MNLEILYKYIEGTCSEKELEKLAIWLKENPANEDFFQTFIEQSTSRENDEFDLDARAAWKKFKNNYGIPADSNDAPPVESFLPRDNIKQFPSTGRKRKRGQLYWAYTAVAAVIIIVSASFIVKRLTFNRQHKQSARKVAYQKVTTSRGQRTNLTLSDGTRVVLNSESTLQIPEDYGSSTRKVILDGEAFFTVQHNPKNPFTVLTPHAYIKDIGTKFNVMAYDSALTEVAVTEGMVSLGKFEKRKEDGVSEKVAPNKLGILKDNGDFEITSINDISRYTGWTEGKLVFRKTPFSEVAKRLERWFDLECEIKDSQLKSRTLTATYDNMPLSEVLKVMSLSLHISYNHHNRTIIFRDGEAKK